MKKLFLLDGMALLFRAHYAFIKNPRISSKGLNTSALYGFTNALVEILNKEKPTHIGVSFDTKAPTFRNEMYTEYKANRQETPEDISVAIPLVKELVKAFDIPLLIMDGYEADDIIGTIAKKAAKEGFEVFMMTPDKDYCQLVEKDIKIYKPAYMGKPAEVIDEKKVLENWSISEVDQVVDMLGLMGDSVDNIPGIPGVGQKTAQKLLDQYGTVENLVEHRSELKGKLKERVEENSDMAILSKQLARIKIDVPIDFNAKSLEFEGYEKSKDKILPLFEEFEFKTLTKRLFAEEGKSNNNNGKNQEPVQIGLFAVNEEEEDIEQQEFKRNIYNTNHQYHLIDTVEGIKNLLPYLEVQERICFDTETSSIDPISAELVGISFCYFEKEAFYIDLNHKEYQAFLNELKPILENEKIIKIGQNIKYDIQVLKNYGIQVNGELFDTMIAHYLIAPEQRHNMDFISEKYLNYTPISITKLIGEKGKDQKNMQDLEASEIFNYACEDADITFQLYHCLKKELNLVGLTGINHDIESKLIYVLADVERNGVRIDSDFLKEYSTELEKDSVLEEQAIYAIAGEKFNIASPKQLGEILFDKLKIDDKPKKTKTGQYSTGEDILLKYQKKHPIVDHILGYREINKLKSTYVDALPQLVNPVDGKVHTSFNQTVAATGRLSSINPNLQNIPIRTERGRKIRQAFIPDSGNVLLSADYSQVELRIMAHLSKDVHMIESFSKGEDIHKSTAAKVFGVTLEEVTSEMRRKAKMVNFGIIYGISAFGLSQRLDIPRKEASEIIESYFREFPSVKTYMDNCIQKAREKEFSETMFGRRRYLKDINSRNHNLRSFAERNAINAPIQGTAADIIKIAMINIENYLRSSKMKTKMILQVHDELVFDVPQEELEKVQPKIETMMSKAVELKVPLDVESGSGKNWLEAH